MRPTRFCGYVAEVSDLTARLAVVTASAEDLRDRAESESLGQRRVACRRDLTEAGGASELPLVATACCEDVGAGPCVVGGDAAGVQ